MFKRVMTKQTKRFGKVYPSEATPYQIDLYRGITIFLDHKDGTTKQGKFFQVGDTAEYGSYNLRYTGEITKITEKCVTIVAYKGSPMEKAHRLNMNEFCWRNFSFDAVETANFNNNEMMYI